MAQTPPSLQYLAIYNPTLQPSTESLEGDDEDREEQAHIVFYTAKERAESRDKMLRRVGLAKALVKFSEMFNSEDLCNNIHSQSRRMVIISPEPNYYIHACIEVAKVLKPPQDKKGKSKEKDKGKDKQKQADKGKGKEQQQPAYDYLDGLVHDVALRTDLMKGYEQFKLTHGSFSTIFETLGREALELQLERFFTVWAWSWNLDEGANFEDQMGVELHPLFPSIIPLLDTFSSGVDGHPAALVLLPPYAVPSTRYLEAGHPPALVHRLVKSFPVPPSESDGATLSPTEKQPADGSSTGESMLMFPSSISNNILSTMDVRKWNWSGYLTFGKSHSRAPSIDRTQLQDRFEAPSDSVAEPHATEVSVDKNLLNDAMSSHASESTHSSPKGSGRVSPSPEKTNGDDLPRACLDGDEKDLQQNDISLDIPEPISEKTPVFSTTTAHLSFDETIYSARQSIHYIISGDPPTMVAFFGLPDDEPNTPAMQSISFSAQALIKDIHRVIEDDLSKTIVDADAIPTAANILQASDRHLVTTSGFKISSAGFTSKSGTLFEAQLIQEADPGITEVFSRGQNPQHWHIAKRGVGPPSRGPFREGSVYLEIFRKETSLPDVDNVLARVVNKSGLLQGNESANFLSI